MSDEDYLSLLGTRVRAARQARALSRKQLSEFAEVSERYLAQLEGGSGNASMLILRRIARRSPSYWPTIARWSDRCSIVCWTACRRRRSARRSSACNATSARIEFATRYDPQPFHVDPVAAKATRWDGIIASGFHTCSVAMRLMVDHVLAGSESNGSPGLSSVSWLAPVRPGDTLGLRVEVLSVKLSRSGGTGIVVWNWQLRNQRVEPVLDLVATSLFDLRSLTS